MRAVATLVLAALLGLSAPALAQSEPAASLALSATDSMVLTDPGGLDLSSARRESPDIERALLLGTGALLGMPASLLGGALVFAIAFGACNDDYTCGYGPQWATLASVPITALLTVPAGVFLFGNLSGRGADFGWTLLGGVLGAIPGALMVASSFVLDGADGDSSQGLLIGGAVLGAVGLIGGSVLGFELSSSAGDVTVSPGFGSLSISGEF